MVSKFRGNRAGTTSAECCAAAALHSYIRENDRKQCAGRFRNAEPSDDDSKLKTAAMPAMQQNDLTAKIVKNQGTGRESE